MTDLDLEYADFGLLGSMLSLGLGVGIVAAGPISDRFPRRPLFITACLIVAAATITLGPDTSFEGLIAQLLAVGFGAGFYETVLNAIIVEKFPETAERRLLFIHSSAPLAACVVPILISLAREAGSLQWHESFQLAGLLHLPLALAACFLRLDFSNSRRPADQPVTKSSDPSKTGDRIALAALCGATFSYVGVESALTIFVVDHAATDLGLPAARAAQTISAFWGGLLVGRLGAGLSPRSPGAGTIALLAACAAGMLLAFELHVFGSPEFAMGAIGLALGGVFPVMMGLAGRTLPDSPATALGLAGGLGSLGGFMIPWLTGRLATEVGLPLAFACLAGWLMLLAAVAAVVARRFRRPR